ncbi:isocitrate lyase/phosphoenolpyruvate mutase family protein [Mycetocola sp. JXN-3]|uniref:isocitrate lyase/PEP mutase family protein n=1 Tax=Mycetocola sp. JXN-3 TaxID=2116510 RepID=UPI00165D2AFF|nr:isocitrate lyase/phosphoenolpyruvate mutase family protein [Mycetocola sp. JXN-3]
MNRTETFRSLHVASTPLLLPNAWDVAGARILEEAGAPAIATTSAGIAWAQGAADGGVLNRDRMLVTLESIIAAVGVPVTADIEGGYAESPAGVTDTVRRVCAIGAAGINIEDGPRTPEDTVARIRAAREASTELFINARTDVFLGGSGDSSALIEETLRRAELYLAAGADGIFVPGARDAETIGALTRGIAGPVNIMLGAGTPGIEELRALGVARLSSGSAFAQAAYAALRHNAERFLAAAAGPTEQMDYAELNRLVARG